MLTNSTSVMPHRLFQGLSANFDFIHIIFVSMGTYVPTVKTFSALLKLLGF